MPEVIQRSANGVDVISLDTFNCERRTLCIRGEITQESAFEFALTAAYLNSLSETESITVYINSPGGDIDAGLLMYDVIQTSPAPIRLVALGTAYSMAALLFASGLHGRYLLPNSKLMLHEPLLGYPIGGNTSSIKTISDEEQIEEITKHDHFFTADESVAFGLADEVITFDRLVKEGC